MVRLVFPSNDFLYTPGRDKKPTFSKHSVLPRIILKASPGPYLVSEAWQPPVPNAWATRPRVPFVLLRYLEGRWANGGPFGTLQRGIFQTWVPLLRGRLFHHMMVDSARPVDVVKPTLAHNSSAKPGPDEAKDQVQVFEFRDISLLHTKKHPTFDIIGVVPESNAPGRHEVLGGFAGGIRPPADCRRIWQTHSPFGEDAVDFLLSAQTFTGKFGRGIPPRQP